MDIFIIAILIVAAVILFLVELFIIPGISIAGLLAQEGCSFDCRCKDTKILSRKQAFSGRMLKNIA